MTGGGLNNVRYDLFGSLDDDVLAKIIESAKEPLDRKNFVEALLTNRVCTRFAAPHFSRATMLLQAGVNCKYKRAMNGTLGQLEVYKSDGKSAGAVITLIANGSLNNLTTIDFEYNKIGDKGMKAFANAIKPTPENSSGALAMASEKDTMPVSPI